MKVFHVKVKNGLDTITYPAIARRSIDVLMSAYKVFGLYARVTVSSRQP